jgi:hypothetical protein
MVLTRASFLHRDYFKLYTDYLPREIYDEVADNFNCEDIAMTLFVTALSGGKLPLLADFWAIQGQLKLYFPPHLKISAGEGHKTTRGECVNSYARILGLHGESNTDHEKQGREKQKSSKDATPMPTTLQKAIVRQDKREIFRIGDLDNANTRSHSRSQKQASGRWITDREFVLVEATASWTSTNYRSRMAKLMYTMGEDAFDQGLIENTPPWHDRWKSKKTTQQQEQ